MKYFACPRSSGMAQTVRAVSGWYPLGVLKTRYLQQVDWYMHNPEPHSKLQIIKITRDRRYTSRVRLDVVANSYVLILLKYDMNATCISHRIVPTMIGVLQTPSLIYGVQYGLVWKQVQQLDNTYLYNMPASQVESSAV